MRWPRPPAGLAARGGAGPGHPWLAEQVQPVRYGGGFAS
jgi:hypothetical protein